MKRKTVAILGMLTFAMLTISVIFNNDTIFAKSKEPKVISIHADHKVFEDYKELENHAPIIVQAKFSGERMTVLPKNVGDFLPYSKSKVEITKVIKGNLSKEESIIVLEPAAMDDSRNVFITTEGYNLLDAKGKYTLFLRETPINNSYQIVGMYQGKYDHAISKESNVADDMNVKYNQIVEEEVFGKNIKQFNKLKKQVLKKHEW